MSLRQGDLGWEADDLQFDWAMEAHQSVLDRWSEEMIKAFLEIAPPYKFRPGDLVGWEENSTTGTPYKMVGTVVCLDIDAEWNHGKDALQYAKWAYQIRPKALDGYDDPTLITATEDELYRIRQPLIYPISPNYFLSLPTRIPAWMFGRIPELKAQVTAMMGGEDAPDYIQLSLIDDSSEKPHLWHW